MVDWMLFHPGCLRTICYTNLLQLTYIGTTAAEIKWFSEVVQVHGSRAKKNGDFNEPARDDASSKVQRPSSTLTVHMQLHYCTISDGWKISAIYISHGTQPLRRSTLCSLDFSWSSTSYMGPNSSVVARIERWSLMLTKSRDIGRPCQQACTARER
jgi:hypothetical protein